MAESSGSSGSATSSFFSAWGAVLGAYGSKKSARAVQQEANAKRRGARLEAAEMEQQATLSVASAQRQMLEERRQARLLESRALALAAASGAGASDNTVVRVISRIAAEGAYRSSLALYDGLERERQLRTGASVRREGGDLQFQYGKNMASAYNTQAAGALFAGGATLYSRYAGNSNPPPSSGGDSSGGWVDAGTETGSYG